LDLFLTCAQLTNDDELENELLEKEKRERRGDPLRFEAGGWFRLDFGRVRLA